MAALPCGWSDTLTINRYITSVVVRWVVIRRAGHQHSGKNKRKGSRPKKDKPPSRTLNRIAKFTRNFFKGKFGFFYYVPNILRFTERVGGVGCRSPPNQLFREIQKRLIGGTVIEKLSKQ